MLIVMLSASVMAGMGDKVLAFSTTGLDRYADGTVVSDGECYALVWSPAGTTFAGFNADGTALSPNDRVVLAAPLAKDGRCRESLFQIPAAEYEELKGGEWQVCLVDTRTADGVPAGVAANAPRRVNRWGTVKSDVKVAPSAVSALKLAAAQKPASNGVKGISAMSDDGAYADVLSAVPESVKPPKITAFEVSEGVVRLTVSDTVPFLTYTLSSGDAPNALSADSAADRVDGDAKSEISIEADAAEGSRFFRVTRAE